MTSLNQRYAFPRVTTRGYYDLRSGKAKPKRNQYGFYPKYKLDKLKDAKDVVVFVHGMRNTRWGAVHGARLLRNKLRKLGCKYPVVAFSYDADVREAHKESKYHQVLKTAYKIAEQNGANNLSQFIIELRLANPDINIHLVGHSLGCDLISNITTAGIKSTHFFGSPVELNDLHLYLGKSIKTTNYYNPTDDVIKEGVEKGIAKKPSCLHRYNNPLNGLVTKRCYAKDHRFSSYLEKLRKFP